MRWRMLYLSSSLFMLHLTLVFPQYTLSQSPSLTPSLVSTSEPMEVPTSSPTLTPTSAPTIIPPTWSNHQGSHQKDGSLSLAKNSYLETFSVGFTRAETLNNNDLDAFVRKFKADSIIQDWKLRLGGPGHDIAYSVVTDSAGNAYVCGTTSQALPGYANAGGTDMFLSKLGRDGVELWHVQFGTVEDDTCFKVRINQDESKITITGSSGDQQIQTFFTINGDVYVSPAYTGSREGL